MTASPSICAMCRVRGRPVKHAARAADLQIDDFRHTCMRSSKDLEAACGRVPRRASDGDGPPERRRGDHDFRQLAVGAGDPEHRRKPGLLRHLHRCAALPWGSEWQFAHGSLRRGHRSLERWAGRWRGARAGPRTGAEGEPRGLRRGRGGWALAADADPLPRPLAPARRRREDQHNLGRVRHPRVRAGRGERLHGHDLRTVQPLRRPGRLCRVRRRGRICRKLLSELGSLTR